MAKDKEKTANASSSDPNYVFQLTDAEKKAREVLEAARKRRATKLKKAKDEALQEVETIKAEYDGKLSSVVKSQDSFKDTASLQFDKEFERTANELRSAFKNNRAKALEFVIGKVLDVAVESHKNLT